MKNLVVLYELRALLFCIMLLATGCGTLAKIARTLPDVAHHACLIFGEDNAAALGPELGFDAEAAAADVGKAYCDHEANVRPFLDQLLQAQELAAQRAGISRE